MKMRVLSDRSFVNEIKDRTVEVEGFNRYSVSIEGAQINSKDEAPRKLSLSIFLDGTLNISLEKTKTLMTDFRETLAQRLPRGYEFWFETEADKVIKDMRGHYYYFRNKNTKDITGIAIGASKREYSIHLGRLDDPSSKLGIVLRSLPDRPFKKAELVHILPQNIVENRQPIKAAIDVLEKEEFIRELKKVGISQQYVRTDKIVPHVKEELPKQ